MTHATYAVVESDAENFRYCCECLRVARAERKAQSRGPRDIVEAAKAKHPPTLIADLNHMAAKMIAEVEICSILFR